MKKLSSVLDTALTLAALFLLGAILIGYFAPRTTALFFALIFALTATYFTSLWTQKRQKPKAHKQKLEGIRNKFLFSPAEYAQSFVREALCKKDDVQETDGLLLVGKTAFSVHLIPEKVNARTLADRYAAATRLHVKRLVLLSAYGGEKDAVSTAMLLSQPKVEILDFERTYALLSYLGCPPTETLRLQPAKKRLRSVAAGALRKKNARKYLTVAILTLLFARFTPYGILYIAVSATALVLALLCRIDIVGRIAKKT